nr:hypothetical protein [Rarobacter incanus]
MPFQRGQVDGVGEVCRQQFVAFSFEHGAVGGEVGELLIPTGALLVERRIDFGGEVPVVGFTDRDVAVGVLDQPLSDLDGDGASGAGGLLRCAHRANEVRVSRPAGVCREVQQQTPVSMVVGSPRVQ